MSDRDELLRGIVDVLDYGVRTVDADRRLLYWNREAERITGFASQDVPGSRCCEGFVCHVDEGGQALPPSRCPLAKALADGRTFGVVMLDVDSFKGVNDTFGHAVGDRVLEIVGKTLRNSLRPFDAVGRWGGDEFLALV